MVTLFSQPVFNEAILVGLINMSDLIQKASALLVAEGSTAILVFLVFVCIYSFIISMKRA